MTKNATANRVTTADIAKRLYHDALHKSLMLNTSEIQARYGLNESQAQAVKQRVKRLAANEGVTWAWDPVLSKFRVVPSNARDIYTRCVEYATGRQD